MNRTTHAFSSLSSIVSSSSRVRIARSPLDAMLATSPMSPGCSRAIPMASVVARTAAEVPDHRADRRADPDGRPRVAADVRVGLVHRELGAVLDGLLDLAELLLGGVQLGGGLALDLGELRFPFRLQGLQELLCIGNDVLNVTPEGVRCGGAAAAHGGLLWNVL